MGKHRSNLMKAIVYLSKKEIGFEIQHDKAFGLNSSGYIKCQNQGKNFKLEIISLEVDQNRQIKNRST